MNNVFSNVLQTLLEKDLSVHSTKQLISKELLEKKKFVPFHIGNKIISL